METQPVMPQPKDRPTTGENELLDFLLEALPPLNDAKLSQSWEAYTEVSWASLPIEAKLNWAQVSALARVSASFEEIQKAFALLLAQQDRR